MTYKDLNILSDAIIKKVYQYIIIPKIEIASQQSLFCISIYSYQLTEYAKKNLIKEINDVINFWHNNQQDDDHDTTISTTENFIIITACLN